MSGRNDSALSRDQRNLVVFRGDSLELTAEVRDLQGDPVDISGADNIIFSIAKEAGDEPVVTYEYVAGDIDIGSPDSFIVPIKASDTGDLDDVVYWPDYQSATLDKIDRKSIEASYYYEARIIDGDRVSTVLSGRLFVRASSIEEMS